jgi:hypothetical protein
VKILWRLAKISFQHELPRGRAASQGSALRIVGALSESHVFGRCCGVVPALGSASTQLRWDVVVLPGLARSRWRKKAHAERERQLALVDDDGLELLGG